MNRAEIEKSLKRFLKKKVAYTLSVLVSFLITGGLSFGAEVTSKEIIDTQKVILNKIKIEREKITKKLIKNKEALKDSELELNFLIKEADFYSQPFQPSYGFSIIGNRSIEDKSGKDWKGSLRKNTSMDMTRSLFDESLGKKQDSNLSSGWINMDGDYSLNTNVYDAVSKLFILPVVKPPVIIEPTVPTISFTVPTPPTIIAINNPTIATINLPTITVNPISPTLPSLPSQMPSPNAPGNINISVNEPNINVEIGEIEVVGPGELTIPELDTPNIVVSLNPVVPPAIILPDPEVEELIPPSAPNFTRYSASEGAFLDSAHILGINYFNPNILLPVLGFTSTTGTIANGGVLNQTNIAVPIFENISILNGSRDVRGKVFAYRDSTGGHTGYTNIQSPNTLSERTPSFSDGPVIPGTENVPSYIAGTTLTDKTITQKNKWLLYNGSTNTIENIDFRLGGEDQGAESGVLFMRNDGNITIKNSTIELMGKTSLILDILHGTAYPTSVKFENTEINITGNENTLFSNVPHSDMISVGSLENNSKNPAWGTILIDNGIGKKGVLGSLDLNIETKINTIYAIVENGSYRWNGAGGGIGNPESFLIYNPLMGRVRFENKDSSGSKGTFYFNGSENVGAWISKYTPDRTKYSYNAGISLDEKPMIDLGQIMMNGDSNVGMYFAGHTTRPDFNGIYQGSLPVDFRIGTSLNGTSGSSQTVAGNADGDAGKTSGNVALFVSSGQRIDLTVANGYFPATTDQLTSGATQYLGQGIAIGTQIGYHDLNTAAHAIQNLKITDYKVEFGKYSKGNIAIVAKNGSIVELNPAQTVITDGLLETTPDNERAEGTIIAFAEGVWFNPRVAAENRAPNDGQAHTDGKVVIDGTSGQKYVPGYGSSVIIHKPIKMGSKGATAAFAKDGAMITTKDITIYGGESTGVFATGTKKWLDEGAKLEQAAAGGGTTAQSIITVNGDIKLIAGNDNKGIVAMSGATGDGAIVTVSGDVTVVGLGAYVEGINSKINIIGTNSTLTSGSEGSLVALNGGTLEFGGGTLEHNTEDQLAFYSSSAGNSKLSFNGATTLNIGKGIVFYGKATDFIAAPGVTGRYNGMGNLTVNLTNHGVNLGVFEDANVIWNGSTSYVDGLKLIPKVKAINTGSFWYESSLDGGTFSIATDVNRDNISAGTTAGDGFNDITMERKEVTLESGKNIVSLKGKGILLGSNSKAVSNTESGYTIKGNIDISDVAGTEAVAIYTSYGHTNIDTLGKITVSEGIGAYGINGSIINNQGKIEIKKSNETIQGKGIVVLATNALGGNVDSYGKNSGKTGNWGEVINTGEIAISGTHGIGIYMENNHNSAPKNEMVITNTAPIELGDSGTGIAIKSNTTTNVGGTLNLKDSGNDGKDIKVGKEGIGVYAQNSDIIFDGNYGIVIKDDGVALQVEGNSIVKGTNSSDKLTVEYDGASGVGNTAIGIAFQGTSSTDKFTNKLNINVENTQNAETIVALYGIGSGILENSGEIEVKSTGAYGILSKGVDIKNTGKITVGDSTIPVSGAVGIYAKGASITTDGGNINIIGNGDSVSTDKIYPIGIYAESYIDAAGVNHGGNVIIGNSGTAMNISGNSGIGIYMDDKAGTSLLLTNSSDIDLTDSSTLSDRKLGIFLANASNTSNITTGEINVGKNNIGIYNKDSILINSGTINVLNTDAGTQNIGIHNATESGNFKFTNQGNINVQGVSNIGISLVTSGVNKGEIVLNGGDIKVEATSLSTTPGNMPIGIYGVGNNIEISASGTSNNISASPNSVGIYLEGDDTSKINGDISIALKSDVAGTMGIGTYYKGGSYGASGTITLSSDLTAMDGTGNPVRPIGLFYGTNSTKNGQNINISAGSGEVIGIYTKGLSSFANSGNIDINAKGIGAYFVGSNITNSGTVNIDADEAYGLYFKGGVSSQSNAITVNNKKAVGVIITETGGIFTNETSNTISSNAISSIGVYAENNGTFINEGTLNSTLASIPGATVIEGSIGAFANGGTITNNGTINAEYLGLYGKDAATINTTGTININSGVGVLVESLASVGNLNGGTISGATNGITGVVAKDTGIVNLTGTSINLTGTGTVGIVLDTGASSTLTSGNITVGAGGTGIYATDSTLTLSGYTGTISMGNEGIGIYSKNSTLSQGTLNINYTGANTGIGVYYEGTNPVTNQASINHTGTNLVSIYGTGVSLTNTAAQGINDNGIGIYAINGADIYNQGRLTLSGEDTIGIYLADATSKISEIGTIDGTNLTANKNKIGVYVADGDIVGNTAYNFGVSGGIGMYLKKSISYTGTMSVSGDSTVNNRTIGIYVDPTITAGTLGTKIDVTGANAIGIYLASVIPPLTPSASNITYNGEVKITSTSTAAERGIGVLLAENTAFTLGTGGKVEIGGLNNIGFFVKKGATLNVAGGTVINTPDGIFAYLEEGTLNFTTGSTINIDYANVIVSGTSGSISNDTNITVGTTGLQGDSGATITNSLSGTITGTGVNAKAMVGTGIGTTITNDGTINLTGDSSIGMYVTNGAIGNSSGQISVGKKSTSYYASTGIFNISGTTTVGEESTLFYADGGTINYTGANIVMGNKSIALALRDGNSNVDFGNKEIEIGIKGTGIFIDGSGDIAKVSNLGKLKLQNGSTGIFIDNSIVVTTGVNIDLIGSESIGIYNKNGTGAINYTGNIQSSVASNKGIINTGTGITTNSGTIKLVGDSSVGIYGENGSVVNSSIIEVANGSTLGSAVGIYGKNLSSISSTGDIKIGEDAIGIYGENVSSISNSSTITGIGNKNTGIYGVSTNVQNTGTITLNNSSNGIYVNNGTINNTGTISVGSISSSGIYGGGTTSITHSGSVTVGDNSTGVATKNGTITVSSGATIAAGKNSTYIYTESGMATNNTDLTLSDHSIGMYTKSGSMFNTATIIVGKSTVISGTTPEISVGMATESGTIENSSGGHIIVSHDYGVGMVANNGGIGVNKGTIDVDGNNAYGMQATDSSTLINDATIKINGTNSRGIAATNDSVVLNNGMITVNGTSSEGIYVDYGSTVDNKGTITVTGAGTGIFIGQGGVLLNEGTITIASGSGGNSTVTGSGGLTNVGDIVIDGGQVTIDGIVITNGGTITVNGALDFGTISLGGVSGNIGTINADSFNDGKIIILPDVTQGSNHEVYTVQYLNGLLNEPNQGSLEAISQSVTWIAKLEKDDNDPNLVKIVMVKIPYKKILAGTDAFEFGKGLDELYAGAANKELEMFDFLDKISNKDELGATFDNELRGNVYSNVQTRILDINEVFNSTYESLKTNKYYARETLKIGAIMSSGEIRNKKAGVEDYDLQSLGLMVLQESDSLEYERNYNWSAGFAETKFDFDLGSKETVYSINGGIGLEDYIKNSRSIKYYTRGELGINHHTTDRKISLGNESYENTGKFWSGTVEWKNKLRYEVPLINNNINIGVFGNFNLGYGKFQDFQEKGDGIELEVETKDMYIIRPGIGADISYKKNTKIGKFSISGKISADYELGEVYDGANRAKIKGTTAGFYELEEPKKLKEIFKMGIEAKYETEAGHSIGLEVMREEGSTEKTKYGLNLMYKF